VRCGAVDEAAVLVDDRGRADDGRGSEVSSHKAFGDDGGEQSHRILKQDDDE
jgi:hypothetical protein